jgi:hypothetical protein
MHSDFFRFYKKYGVNQNKSIKVPSRFVCQFQLKNKTFSSNILIKRITDLLLFPWKAAKPFSRPSFPDKPLVRPGGISCPVSLPNVAISGKGKASGSPVKS